MRGGIMEAVIGGRRVGWRERGAGQTVLFVHGFPFHGAMWDEQLDRLPDRWRWVAPDLRGFGRSEPGDVAGPLTMERHADDLAELLDHLEVERATLCGLSMGGYVAFAFWRRHPERIHSLVLCDTRSAADDEVARRGRVQAAIRVRREGTGAVAEEMIPRLISETTRRERPEVEARLRAIIESNPPESVARAQEGMAERPDSTALLPTITVPTLLVVGTEDPISPPDEMREMAGRIPDARLRVIDGAAHLPCIERPEAFNRELVHFLEATTAHGV